MSFKQVFTDNNLSHIIFSKKFNNSDTHKNITINKKNLIEELKSYGEMYNEMNACLDYEGGRDFVSDNGHSSFEILCEYYHFKLGWNNWRTKKVNHYRHQYRKKKMFEMGCFNPPETDLYNDETETDDDY
tara:strand:+ start:277 stop:666 length:390 start_codon:yes stop_codon:yes gene_type:complete